MADEPEGPAVRLPILTARGCADDGLASHAPGLERQAVEARADLRHGRCVLVRDPEVAKDGPTRTMPSTATTATVAVRAKRREPSVNVAGISIGAHRAASHGANRHGNR